MSSKTAFVFSGGGSLGAVQVGMLRALVATGVRPDFILGSSVGALNACYFASAPTMDTVARLEEIWVSLRRRDVFPISFISALGFMRHPDCLVDPGRLRGLIRRQVPYVHLEEASVPVHVVATDFQGLPTSFSKGLVVDAILASTAIPGIFPPVQIEGRLFMDGAVATNTPIRLAAELGATRIIVLPTGYACALKEPPKGAIGKALHAITLMTAWQLIRDNGSIRAALHVGHLRVTLELIATEVTARRAAPNPTEMANATWRYRTE